LNLFEAPDAPQVAIRLAEPRDAEAVAGLIHTLEIHYGGEAPPLESTLAMVRASMAEQEGTRHALAFVGGQPVGLACFAVLRPGFRLTGLVFLKELFVEEKARGQAVGAALMRWLAEYARARGLGRIDLTTEASNRGARAFYERLGAEPMDKVFYRFNLSTPVLTEDREAPTEEKA
jgi:GNAT superfamily N-acetyltransferase